MTALDGTSTDPNVPGVSGENGTSRGLIGGKDPILSGAVGVYGESLQTGVFGRTASPTPDDSAVYGQNDGAGRGVAGASKGSGTGVDGVSGSGRGVHGQNGAGSGLVAPANVGTGVSGESDNGIGVYGSSGTNYGVMGESQDTNGVMGVTHSATVAAISAVNQSGGIGLWAGGGIAGQFVGNGTGVDGLSGSGHGVHGQNGHGSGLVAPANVGTGVSGESDNGIGVYGSSGTNYGVMGESQDTNGVMGVTHSATGAAISAINRSGGVGVWATGRIAGQFVGDIEVTGDIRLTGGQDCAEDFDVCGDIEPGTVMVIQEQGGLQQSDREYDKRVAGVVSGAGDYHPGIVLGRQVSQSNRVPIALVGRVYCKVDARHSPIEVGDLLTTSATPGYAMRADYPARAIGALIGKALHPLSQGQGLIPILVALQ